MLSMIVGIDNGYNYTKLHNHLMIKSAYTRTDNTLSDYNKIIINDVPLYYGVGNIQINQDKIDMEINEVCTLSILSLLENEDLSNLYLVCGLPIQQYKMYKDKFRETILSYNNRKVIRNNKLINFNIKDVSVFAQGAGVLFGFNIQNGIYIVLDIGSYTINAVLVEMIDGIPNILNYDTWYDGILTLHENIIKEAKKRFPITADLDDAERFLKYGISVLGDSKDTKFIDDIKKDYINNIFTKLHLGFKGYATTPILLAGGGAEFLKDNVEELYGNAIVIPNAQFLNAEGYYRFGLQKYGNQANNNYGRR